MNWLSLLDSLAAPTVPPLPDLALMRRLLDLSWGLVLSAVVLAAISRQDARRIQWAGVGVLFLSCQLPGVWAPSYWLGLSFQAPSVSSSLLAAWYLQRKLRGAASAPVFSTSNKAVLWHIWLGVALGWLLLLDTFALLPWSLFAMGFSPMVPGLVLLCALLPWLLMGRHGLDLRLATLILSVLLLYIGLRIPNGNFWAALLDPWLWLGLNGMLLRSALQASRKTENLKKA